MNLKTLFLLSVLISAAACSNSTPPQHFSLSERPPLFHEVSGNNIRSVDKPRLRHGETLKAYSLGRRVDAADPSLMHESSIIYRIENDSSWNLQPGLPPKIPFAGESPLIVGDNEDALRAEIEVKANEQRQLYKYMKNASEQVAVQIKDLQSSANISLKLLEQNKLLKNKLTESELKNKKLQQDLSKMQEQLQALFKFYRKNQEEQIKSKFRR